MARPKKGAQSARNVGGIRVRADGTPVNDNKYTRHMLSRRGFVGAAAAGVAGAMIGGAGVVHAVPTPPNTNIVYEGEVDGVGYWSVTPTATHPDDSLHIQWVIENTTGDIVINLEAGTFKLGTPEQGSPYGPDCNGYFEVDGEIEERRTKYRFNDGTIFVHDEGSPGRTITLRGVLSSTLQIGKDGQPLPGKYIPETVFERGYHPVTIGVMPTFYGRFIDGEWQTTFSGNIPHDPENLLNYKNQIEAIRFGWSPDWFWNLRPVLREITDPDSPNFGKYEFLYEFTENYKYFMDMQGTRYSYIEYKHHDPNYDSSIQNSEYAFNNCLFPGEDPNTHNPALWSLEEAQAQYPCLTGTEQSISAPTVNGDDPEWYVVRGEMCTPSVKCNIENIKFHNPRNNHIWVGAASDVDVKNCHFIDGRSQDASVWRFTACHNAPSNDLEPSLCLALQAIPAGMRTQTAEGSPIWIREQNTPEGVPTTIHNISGVISFTNNFVDANMRVEPFVFSDEATRYETRSRHLYPEKNPNTDLYRVWPDYLDGADGVVYRKGIQLAFCNCTTAASSIYNNNVSYDSHVGFLTGCYPEPDYFSEGLKHEVTDNIIDSTGITSVLPPLTQGFGILAFQTTVHQPTATTTITRNKVNTQLFQTMATYSSNIIIKENEINSPAAIAPVIGEIFLQGSSNSTVENNTLTGFANRGLTLLPGAPLIYYSFTPSIRNFIKDNDFTGLTAQTAEGVPGAQIGIAGDINEISNNVFGPADGFGIVCAGNKNTFLGNTLQSSLLMHALIPGNDNTFGENNFGTGPLAVTVVAGISINGGERNTIENNTFEGYYPTSVVSLNYKQDPPIDDQHTSENVVQNNILTKMWHVPYPPFYVPTPPQGFAYSITDSLWFLNPQGKYKMDPTAYPHIKGNTFEDFVTPPPPSPFPPHPPHKGLYLGNIDWDSLSTYNVITGFTEANVTFDPTPENPHSVKAQGPGIYKIEGSINWPDEPPEGWPEGEPWPPEYP